jgi:hypothetical protein
MDNPRNSIPLPDKALGKLHYKVPFATYSERIGINATGLKDILKSPGHYRANSLQPVKASPAMELGTLVHALLLEPKRAAAIEVKGGYALLPADDAKAEPSRHTVASFETAQRMADAVRANDVATRLLAKGRSEVSMWWHDPVHKAVCKARVDFIAEDVDGKPMALDIKTARDVDRDSFAKASHNYRYDLQAAHYCEAGRETGAFDHNRFAFIVVKSTPPFYAPVYFVGSAPGDDQAVGDRFLDVGSEWREYAMRVYKRCVGSGSWDFPVAERLQLPPWSRSPQDLIDRGELEDV